MESEDKALKVASNEKPQQQLAMIDEHHLRYEMVKHGEEFLLEYNGSKKISCRVIATFKSVLHYEKFDIRKLPCTSETIKLHIRRAFLEIHQWTKYGITESIPLYHGTIIPHYYLFK